MHFDQVARYSLTTRILCALAAFALAFSLIPVTVLTASAEPSNTVVDVKLSYRYADFGAEPQGEAHAYNPALEDSWPIIFNGRNVVFSATLIFDDGTTQEISEKSDQWLWSVKEGADIVDVDEETQIVSTGSLQDGTAKLGFSLLQYTDYVAPDVVVRIRPVPDDSVAPVAISLRYIDAAHSSETAYNGSVLPSISAAGNMIQFFARVAYNNGTVVTVNPGDSDPALPQVDWSLSAVTDWQGSVVTSLVPAISGSGRVTASGSGNGYSSVTATLRSNSAISSSANIRIVLDSSSAMPSALRLYTDAEHTNNATGRTVEISKPKGSVVIHPAIQMSDGSVVDTSRNDVTWYVTYADDAGNPTGEVLARVSQTGVVRATGQGNGFVYITCSLVGAPGVNAKTTVRLSGNGPSPISVEVDFTDDSHSTATAYDPDHGACPQIRAEKASCRLLPHVVYSTGTMASAKDSAKLVEWSIVKTTTLTGEDLDRRIATVSDGYVFATGAGNGIATVRCKLKGHDYYQDIDVHIRGNDGVPWVTKVQIMGEDGRIFGDDTCELSGAGLTQFYAVVTYSNGTQKNSRQHYIPGLVWSAERSKGDVPNLDYVSGQLIAGTEFRSCEVVATVVGGGFYGQDVSGHVWVMYDPGRDDEGAGTPAGSLAVDVVYYSDYKEKRLDAKPVFSKDYSLSYLASNVGASTYTYTFSRGPSSVNGEYTKWGTQKAYGFTINALLAEVGISRSNIISYVFITNDGYVNDQVFDADDLHATRYYYPNFSIGIENGHPSSSGAVPVEACLAFSSYVNYDEDTVYDRDDGNMSSATRFRLCFGLSSTADSNTFRSARNVYKVVMIVQDGQYGWSDGQGNGQGNGDGNGDGNGGNGTGGSNGGGSGAGEGGDASGALSGNAGNAAATTANATGNAADSTDVDAGGAEGTGDGSSDSAPGGSPPLSLREITSPNPGDYYVESPYRVFIALVITFISISLLLGALRGGVSFLRRERQGIYGMKGSV